MITNKAKRITMYKNNSRFSSKIKGCSPPQLLCNLTEELPAVGYYSYTERYALCPLRHKNYYSFTANY